MILNNQGVVKATPVKHKRNVKDQGHRAVGYHNVTTKHVGAWWTPTHWGLCQANGYKDHQDILGSNPHPRPVLHKAHPTTTTTTTTTTPWGQHSVGHTPTLCPVRHTSPPPPPPHPRYNNPVGHGHAPCSTVHTP